MKTSKSSSRFEKASQMNLPEFIAPSFLAHINRVGKQERKSTLKIHKFPKRNLNN